MNSSVAFTTRGSGLGNGSPVADEDPAILMISTAGNLAREAMVYVVPLGVPGTGDVDAEGPRDDRSGVCGESSVGNVFFPWGLTGTWGADFTDCVSAGV